VSQGLSGAAGGGPVTYRQQPVYQRGVAPAALSRAPGRSGPFRSVPDISADAGTSALHDVLPFTASTPARFRGIDCDAASCQTPGLNVFGIQSRADGYDGQVTLKGYDNMTGLGTPAGQNFVKALRAREK
jgi:hypothetical protein